MRASSYGYWSSTPAFVLVATGVVVGLGNIWRLPALAAEYGGSAFLLLYVVLLLLVGMPLLISEWVIGRWMRSNVVWGFRHLAKTAKASRWWEGLGWMALVSAALVLSYFTVVAGWSMGYIFRAASGSLSELNAGNAGDTFYALAADAERSLAWHTIFMATVVMIVAHGVHMGLERASRLLVPTMFALLLGLLLYGLWHGETSVGIDAMFGFRPGSLGINGVFAALSQAFFTLSIGLAVMLTLGGYLPNTTRVVWPAVAVLVFDVLFAVLAGVMIYSLVPTDEVKSGALLLFEQLPLALALSDTPIGVPLALYAMLLLVGLTSALGLLEPVTLRVMERFNVSRVFSTTSAALIIWFVGLLSLLSFNHLADLTPGGRTIAEWILALAGQVVMPLGALGLCVFISRIAPTSMMREAWGDSEATGFRIWIWALRYPVRIALILLIIDATGLIDHLVAFWAA